MALIVETESPGGGTPALATIEQLRATIASTGTVVAGAQIDEALLARLLAAATDRLMQELPERTLDIYPAPVGDPPEDTADPVEVRIPITTPRRVFQVPDLREVVSIATTTGMPSNVIDTPALPAALPSTYQLIRRPREVCALWVMFPWRVTGTELVIVGRWGPAALRVGAPLDVNEAVRDAVLVWAARAYHNRAARFADSVQESSTGNVANYFRNLPADVASTINALRVPGL